MPKKMNFSSKKLKNLLYFFKNNYDIIYSMNKEIKYPKGSFVNNEGDFCENCEKRLKGKELV